MDLIRWTQMSINYSPFQGQKGDAKEMKQGLLLASFLFLSVAAALI